MKVFCAMLFSLLITRAEAQYDPSKIDKKAVQLFDQSMVEGRDGNLKEGLELLKKAVAIDNRYADAYLSMAGMYTELKNYHATLGEGSARFFMTLNNIIFQNLKIDVYEKSKK